MTPESTTATQSSAIADLPLSPPANLRDLGGIKIDGGVFREGFAIRTDDISIVPTEYAQELVDNGLTTIIDLRSNDEVIATGRGALGRQPMSYHHIPLMSNIGNSIDPKNPVLTHETMGHMYVGMIERAASQLVTALNVIAYAPGATAFHCTAGRDRTGVLAALLLTTLGASDDDIITDYAKTGANMPGIMSRSQAVLGPTMKKLGFDFTKLNRSALQEAGMEASMEFFLKTLSDTYGDRLTPLRVAGLSDDTIAQLNRRAQGE